MHSDGFIAEGPEGFLGQQTVTYRTWGLRPICPDLWVWGAHADQEGYGVGAGLVEEGGAERSEPCGDGGGEQQERDSLDVLLTS